MSRFVQKNDAIVVAFLTFPSVTVNTVQLFNCKAGERAGFQILDLVQADGSTVRVSQISDYSTGSPVVLGTVSIVAGTDLAGGMFSSGCWCDRDPLAEGATFYQVDYA